MLFITYRGKVVAGALLLMLLAIMVWAAPSSVRRAGVLGWSTTSEPGPLSSPSFTSQAVVVVDVVSGQMLLGHNAYQKREPGPLAQMLTALTALEHKALNEPVLVSRQAASQPGVRLGLIRGIAVPLGALVRAFWFLGAADAGMSLVEHLAGSDVAFRRQMDDYARREGALETQILSPLGSDHPEQRSTAYDLALIARAVLLHPELSRLVSERRAWAEWDDIRRELHHVNSFLWQYSGATGVKSGFSEGAGYVVAASARRGSRHLVAVILGAPSAESRYTDAVAALEFGFRNYTSLATHPLTDAVPYDVQPGDTLLGISKATGVDAELIQSWNALPDPNRLSAGTRLWLPTAGTQSPSRPTG